MEGANILIVASMVQIKLQARKNDLTTYKRFIEGKFDESITNALWKKKKRKCNFKSS